MTLWPCQCEHPAPGPDLWTSQTVAWAHTCTNTNLQVYKLNIYYTILQYKYKPWRQCRVLKTQIFVLAAQPLKLILVSTLLEHVIGLLLVEGAAHTTICRVHCEDTWAIQCFPLPYTTLDHSYKCYLFRCCSTSVICSNLCTQSLFGWCHILNIKAW